MKRIVLALLALTALALACGLPDTPPADDGGDAVGTLVAATLTASAPAPATATHLPPPLQVAYLKEGNVYLWREGFGSYALTSSGDAEALALSSDGQRVAYVRQIAATPPDYELWAVASDAPGGGHVLIDYTEMNRLQSDSPWPEALTLGFASFAFRPNTHQVFYTTVPIFDGPGYFPTQDLRTVDADTLDQTTLLDFGAGGAFTFSPDGQWLALVAADRIGIIAADGSSFRPDLLPYPPVMTYSEYSYLPDVTWAANGSAFLVAIPPADPLADGQNQVWRILTGGGAAELLGEIPHTPFAWPQGIFSPDLAHMAYLRGESLDRLTELRLAAVDGSDDRLFASGDSLVFYGWAPDGSQFAYADGTALYLGTPSGDSRALTETGGGIGFFAWVDADRVLYARRSGDDWPLRLDDTRSGSSQIIDTLQHFPSAIDFAP